MDGDRKYRQSGYQDSERGSGPFRTDKPRPQGPKLPLDVTGPKLPRLVQDVVASRCFNCAMTLSHDTDFKGKCPKCGASLHCCKQCVHFDSSTRFQCRKPIPVRIAVKDAANECNLFAPIITVARDGVQETNGYHSNGANGANGNGNRRPSHGNGGVLDTSAVQAPRNASDARAAFDSLFKK